MMANTEKIGQVRFDTELQRLLPIDKQENEENLFDYDISAPVDALNVAGGKTDWNSNLTTAYNKLGLGSYTWSELDNINIASVKSQDNLIDLIRMYEGNPKDKYKAVMSNSEGTLYGFGLTNVAIKYLKLKIPSTQTEAYSQLIQWLEVCKDETSKYIGYETYNKLPKSVQGALLDYHFKNGLTIMKDESKLKEIIENAVSNGSAANWSAVIKELVWTKPAKKPFNKQKDNPGIYRRSLSRAILAAKGVKQGMSKNDAAVIDNTIKEIYDNAIKCSKANNNRGLSEIEAIYQAYTGNTPAVEAPANTPQNTSDRNKYIVPRQMGLFSAATAIMPDNIKEKTGIEPADLRKALINEIIRLNNIPTDGVDDNGYPKVRLLEQGEQLILPTSLEVNGKTLALQAPANWEGVNIQVQSENNMSSDNESESDEESVRLLDLLYQMDANPALSNIGTDKNLQCATFKYKVQKGDTIYRLALRYGIDWRTLLENNGMTINSTLQIGQELKINKIIYTVKNGDNLTQISKKYGLTVDYIRDANNLENADKLSIGQLLEFPGYVYTVKKGDNLTQISKKVEVDIAELGKLNGLKHPYTIQPGQKLLILFNDADYNVSDVNKTTQTDDKGNTITTVQSDNTALTDRKYLVKKKVNGNVVACTHTFLPTKSGNLSDKTIVINAGHGYKAGGGKDPGTLGSGGLDDEWLINYDNAMRLANELTARGAKVIYIQGYRSLVSDALSNCGKIDMFISIHTNSASNGAKDRTQFYYRNDKQNDNSWGARSKKFAEIAEKKFDNWIPQHETINNNEKFYNNGVVDYAQATTNDSRTGILRTAINKKHVPSILWEVAFMTNAKGRARLSNSSLMNSYASVMAGAVEEYFNTYKIAPTSSTTTPKPADKNTKTHTVKKDDTLGGIAKQYGVTIEQIKKWNNLKGNTIKTGQKLVIKKK